MNNAAERKHKLPDGGVWHNRFLGSCVKMKANNLATEITEYTEMEKQVVFFTL
jgi:hypothetical protein